MNNYEKTEKLNDIMKNLCSELIEDYASVEDAYYVIDQNNKPEIVVIICRTVNNEDYKEKAIFRVDSDDVPKFFLIDMNRRVSVYQIQSMTFNSLFVLYDIFKAFVDEYDAYKRYASRRSNDELEEDEEQRNAMYGEWFRKGYEAGVRDANEKDDIAGNKGNKKIVDEIENAIKKGIIEGFDEWLKINAKNKEAEEKEEKK